MVQEQVHMLLPVVMQREHYIQMLTVAENMHKNLHMAAMGGVIDQAIGGMVTGGSGEMASGGPAHHSGTGSQDMAGVGDVGLVVDGIQYIFKL